VEHYLEEEIIIVIEQKIVSIWSIWKLAWIQWKLKMWLLSRKKIAWLERIRQKSQLSRFSNNLYVGLSIEKEEKELNKNYKKKN
jgi:hypothetical protein